MISNFEMFQEIQNNQILKVTALYLMWNPEICQDPRSCGQDDLVLYLNSSWHLYLDSTVSRAAAINNFTKI